MLNIFQLLCCLAGMLCAQSVAGQPVQTSAMQDTAEWLTVDKIFVTGNEKTKEKIILRELSLSKNQMILSSELDEILKADRKKLLNTQLFLEVTLSPVRLESDSVDLIVRVVERWYTIPSPFFRLADRNFNVWLTTQNRDWRRVEYGVRFFKYNFRGLNERLYFYTQFGFTRQFAMRYVIPYIDKAQKNGLEFRFGYSENSNISYLTRDHQLIFTDSLPGLAARNYKGMIGWRYRPSFYNNHWFIAGYVQQQVADTISELNPNYFLHTGNRQQYFTLSYGFRSDHRDYIAYPLKGYRWEVEVQKLGIGIFDDLNMVRVEGGYQRYVDLGKGFYFAGSAQGYLSAPRRQPYANFIGLGYNRTWLRGYELEAIEGQAYVIQQNTLSKRVFSRKFDLSRVVPIPQFSTLPLSIYLKGYADQGYLRNTLPYEQSNRLNNRYLMGYGLGVDVVSFYDFVIRLERSWRINGDPGFYFHLNKTF